MPTQPLAVAGAVSGLLGVTAYFLAAFVPLPDSLGFLCAMLFPVLLTVFIYSLREVLHAQHPSHSNQLSFVFGAGAFVIVAVMLSAQSAVQVGIDLREADPAARLIKQLLRWIDLGIDVAWDVFIGSYMLLFGLAAWRSSPFKHWGLASAVLGALLIGLNVATFPYPPADKNLFDIGPFIALFWVALQVRLLVLGLRGR